MKIRTRLIVILATACTAVILIALLGLWNGYATRAELHGLYSGGIDDVEEVTYMQELLSGKFVEPLHQLSLGTITWLEASQSLQVALDQTTKRWNQYLLRDTKIVDAYEGTRVQIEQRLQTRFQEWNRLVANLQDILQKQDTTHLKEILASDVIATVDALLLDLNALIHLHVKDLRDDYQQAVRDSIWYQNLTIMAFLAALAVLVPLTLLNARGIIKPLEYAIDCIAVSQDIKTSIAHLSSGATETAAAVTETTTTIEELKQTADISVDKAKDVLANAQETLQAVSSSEKSVTSTLEDINQIRDRMQVISDSILKLSEKSLAIAEIMDSVGDIAEQSNLLAVNAAIEAAKAGEAGRSFSIVAQEIRTLAEQSKGATVQVRSLLNEIQTATNAAVLATEQGSKAVAKGVDQSTKTNQTIQELTGKMTRVTQAANQIVLSNQQQRIGTEQITVAISQINEAANQHVEHIKQIEEAVDTLNHVADALKVLTTKDTSSSGTTPRSSRSRKPTIVNVG